MRLLAFFFLAALAVSAQRFEPILVPLVSGLDSPTVIEHAGDGSGRLFIAERPGRIRVVEDGALLEEPFLDIQERVLEGGSQSTERGLLGIAFHPNFAQNGYFFVDYTAVAEAGGTIVSRFRVSPDDPNRADPNSETVFLSVPQPFANHNGGQIAFGPDGYLYIGMGDGGSGNDPGNRAQDLSTLLGKLLRVDVDQGAPAQPAPGNPFLERPGARGEIWAYGLRNPWRFSFDRATGGLLIADVGQQAVEEVNFQPADSSGGENYGWRLMEGRDCFIPPGESCNADGSLVLPILQYRHTGGRCSITGGYRYRGSRFPAHQGVYFYGDYCSQELFGAVERDDGAWERIGVAPSGLSITTFGEDEDGELYVAGLGGRVLRLEGPMEVTIAEGGAVNAASFAAAQSLAPGAIASLFGGGLAAENAEAQATPLPRELGGLRLLLGADLAAPLFFASPGQANFLVPWEAGASGEIELRAEVGEVTSNGLMLALAAVSPGIFTLDQTGDGPAAALFQQNVVALFVTGLGDVTNRPPSGAAAGADPLSETLADVMVAIGGQDARVLFAGLAPGFVGLYQVNVEIPDAVAGEVPVVVTVNGVSSNAATLLIE